MKSGNNHNDQNHEFYTSPVIDCRTLYSHEIVKIRAIQGMTKMIKIINFTNVRMPDGKCASVSATQNCLHEAMQGHETPVRITSESGKLPQTQRQPAW